MGKITAQRHAANVHRGIDASLEEVRATQAAERAEHRATYRERENARHIFTPDELSGASHVLWITDWVPVHRVNKQSVTANWPGTLTTRIPLKDIRAFKKNGQVTRN